MKLPNARAFFGSRRAAVNATLLGALALAGVSAGIAMERAGTAAHADTPAHTTSTPPQSFSDVPPSHWAAPAVKALASKGLVHGDPVKPGKSAAPAYDGNRFVTRYEAAALLDRFAKAIEQGRQPLHMQTQSKLPNLPQSWAKDAQLDLARSNFIPADSPLLQGSGNAPVTSAEFSAALAQVTIRISDRSMALTPSAADFDDADTGRQH